MAGTSLRETVTSVFCCPSIYVFTSVTDDCCSSGARINLVDMIRDARIGKQLMHWRVHRDAFIVACCIAEFPWLYLINGFRFSI